ncbi:CL3702Contig1_01 [Fagus crenata]
MDDISTCGRCTNLPYRKLCLVEPRVHSSTSHGCSPACRKIDGVAAWLFQRLATVFFTSLELCSCVYVDTKGDPDDSDNNTQLICNDGLEKDISTEIPGKIGNETNI